MQDNEKISSIDYSLVDSLEFLHYLVNLSCCADLGIDAIVAE